jgi:tetratricopeptide (TPR) repeat protein
MDWKTVNSKYVKPALAAWRAGRRQQAEEIFRNGLEETGNDGFVALNYAQCLEEGDRYAEAADLYKLALDRLPLPKYQDQARQGLRRVTEKPQVTIPSPRTSPTPPARGRRIGLLSCTKDTCPCGGTA